MIIIYRFMLHIYIFLQLNIYMIIEEEMRGYIFLHTYTIYRSLYILLQNTIYTTIPSFASYGAIYSIYFFLIVFILLSLWTQIIVTFEMM